MRWEWDSVWYHVSGQTVCQTKFSQSFRSTILLANVNLWCSCKNWCEYQDIPGQQDSPEKVFSGDWRYQPYSSVTRIRTCGVIANIRECNTDQELALKIEEIEMPKSSAPRMRTCIVIAQKQIIECKIKIIIWHQVYQTRSSQEVRDANSSAPISQRLVSVKLKDRPAVTNSWHEDSLISQWLLRKFDILNMLLR